jgi:hypothetical protein
MDQKATAAALRITANSRVVSGSVTWSDDGTTMTWSPRRPFVAGALVGVSVNAGARSSGGLALGTARSINFNIAAPRTRRITYKPPRIIHWENVGPQYLSAEKFFLELMNCTRTGGWVVGGGMCSSVTHHTRPRQAPLVLSAAISDKVARPYAKYMADHCVLNHYLNGTSPYTRLAAAGFYGHWGENIASPSGASAGGLAAVEIWYQNESRLRGPNHYTNIMDGKYHRAGIGIWISRCTRLAVDFMS